MFIDSMLKADIGELKALPTEELEIPRLSKKFGEPAILKLQAVPIRKLKEIQELNSRRLADGTEKPDEFSVTMGMIVEAAIEPNFKDSRLLEKFRTPDPRDIVGTMFLPGEIKLISETILKLCEMNGDLDQSTVDAKIKN